MTWMRYLIHDFWTAREFNRRDEQKRASDRASRRRARQLRETAKDNGERIDALEQDLAEATLLLRTLADLCVEKGVLNPTDIAEKAHALDALDGTIDGRMDGPTTDGGDQA